MTKARAPLSLEAALTRVAATIDGGWNAMAELTRHSPGYVRSWADPDKREQIGLIDVPVLDIACAAAGQETPLTTWLLGRLEAANALAPARPGQLVHHAADVASETGDAVSAIIGAATAHTCKATALREVDEAIAALLRARTALFALPDRGLPDGDQPAAAPVPISINRATGPPRPAK